MAHGENVNVSTNRFTSRPQFLGVSLTVLGLLAAVGLGQVIADADFKRLVMWCAFSFSLLTCLFILRNWRLGVGTFFVWILVEDFARKWTGNNILLYFAKDILIVVTYLSYFFSQWKFHRERFQNPLRAPLFLMIAWAVVQFLNPAVHNMLIPFLGFRMSFLYVPMMYLGYSFFRDEKDLNRFFVWTLSLAFIVSLLGVTQTIVGLDFLNPASAPNLRLSLIRVSPGGGADVLRPTSTFVDAGRFSAYLFVMFYIGFGFTAYLIKMRARTSQALRRWVTVCWAIILVGLVMSGQRASILWLAVSVPIAGAAYFYSKDPKHRSKRGFAFVRLTLVSALGLYLMSVFFPLPFQAVYGFYDATINPNSQYSEMGTRPGAYWDGVVNAYEASGLIGHGTGTNSLGLQYITYYETGEETAGDYHTEGGYSTVLWEWGVVGLFLWLSWSIMLIVKLVQTVRTLRFTPYYWIGVAVTLYSFILLFLWFYLGMQVYQQYVAQAFLWFLVGLVFRLPRLPLVPGAPPIVRSGRTLAIPALQAGAFE